MAEVPSTTGARTILCERPNFVWERTIRGVQYRFARLGRVGLTGVLEIRRYYPEGLSHGWRLIHSLWSPATEDVALYERIRSPLQTGDWVEDPDGNKYLVTESDESGADMLAQNGDHTEECTFDWAWIHWGPLAPCAPPLNREKQ